MSTSGYLAPPEQKPEQADLWNQTWRHLDRFLPNLRKELFPESIVKSGAAMKSPRVQPPTPTSSSAAKTSEKQNEKNSARSGEGSDKDGST
jgi:brefeldin A-resistance guanine nucleotide exchange factor 1